MKPARILRCALWLLALSFFATGRVGASNPTFREINLNPNGIVLEVNLDPQGNVLVTDYYAGEIRRIDPATGNYRVYSGVEGASDARGDAAGNIWFSNTNLGTVGKIDESNQLTTWSLPVVAPQVNTAPLGVAVESATRIWFSDISGPRVYSLDPTTNAVCRYAFSGGYSGSYILYYGGAAWVGDTGLDTIVKIDPTAVQVTQWMLSSGAAPDSLAADAQGNIWFAEQDVEDSSETSRSGIRARSVRREPRVLPARPPRAVSSAPAIGKLNPATAQLTDYVDPTGASPKIIVPSGAAVWFTSTNWDTTQSFVGSLTPSAAVGSSHVAGVLAPVAPTVNCSTVAPAAPIPLSNVTGTAAWMSTPYTEDLDASISGFSIVQLPEGSDAYGLTIKDGLVWLGDAGRQRLATRARTYSIFVPFVLR